MASINGRVSPHPNQVPPIVGELEAIFAELPDEELLTKLRGPRRRGPKGYGPVVLWHSYIAFYYLGLPSVSDLIRYLHDSPHVARACGIDWPNVPSQPTFSRFFSKLSQYKYRITVGRIFYNLVRRSYAEYPGFAKSVAIDATDMKAWSNGGHRRPTDKDAGWVVKNDTNGRGKFVWGYKLSLLVDTEYELPVAFKVTSGNTHDLKVAPALLSQARRTNSKFHPYYVTADAGYSSESLRHLIKRQYRAEAFIKVNSAHKKALKAHPETPEFTEAYNRRQAVERMFSRLKEHRRLNRIRVRRLSKVVVHCILSVVVLQAQALATRSRSSVRRVA